ncbi:unnamed protein product [Orchesella dallaii]|uniref:Uncharacterized protein n=1 Tax=Orchesella dallaii TaxID=48710 RepID=A0ABP1QSB2_9HEXA
MHNLLPLKLLECWHFCTKKKHAKVKGLYPSCHFFVHLNRTCYYQHQVYARIKEELSSKIWNESEHVASFSLAKAFCWFTTKSSYVLSSYALISSFAQFFNPKLTSTPRANLIVLLCLW